MSRGEGEGELLTLGEGSCKMNVQDVGPQAQKMTTQQCLHELAQEPNLDQLLALVKVRRYLREMSARGMTGKIEVDVQRGTVRRVWRPEYEDI